MSRAPLSLADALAQLEKVAAGLYSHAEFVSKELGGGPPGEECYGYEEARHIRESIAALRAGAARRFTPKEREALETLLARAQAWDSYDHDQRLILKWGDFKALFHDTAATLRALLSADATTPKEEK